VKFKTAEKVGPVGEGRSAEAQAVVSLLKLGTARFTNAVRTRTRDEASQAGPKSQDLPAPLALRGAIRGGWRAFVLTREWRSRIAAD